MTMKPTHNQTSPGQLQATVMRLMTEQHRGVERSIDQISTHCLQQTGEHYLLEKKQEKQSDSSQFGALICQGHMARVQ